MGEGSIHRRHRAEARFRWYGRLAVGFALLMLVTLVATVAVRGWPAFRETQVRVPVTFAADVTPLKAVRAGMEGLFPAVVEPGEKRRLSALLSRRAFLEVRRALEAHPEWQGTTQELWLTASDGAGRLWRGGEEELAAQPSLAAIAPYVTALDGQGRLRTVFSRTFFTEADSRQPESAGFLGSIVGSLWTVAACLMLAFPLGVMTAIYLEEYAGRGRLAQAIEVNINNLAAIPSIIFGLLGLAVFINLFGLSRSSALVGGLTLGLLILPTIIIASRTALRAVPQPIRDAALALGASPLQVLTHHTLPLAVPGIMTGTILGVARAIGETAPLIMIGMVAFVADIPHTLTDPASAMPVQVFLWADSPERTFAEKTAAGILVLLGVFILINLAAVIVRQRFERRW